MKLQKTPPTEIQGGRISLRARSPSQAEEMFQMIDRNRAHLAPWMPWEESTRKVEDSKAYIQLTIDWWNSGKTFDYSLFEKSSGKMIGSFGLHSLDWNERTCHFGFWLDQNHEGKGYVSEALLLGEKIAQELGFQRLILTCDAKNKRSAQVALRNHYTLESRSTDDALDRGQVRETLLFVKHTKAG